MRPDRRQFCGPLAQGTKDYSTQNASVAVRPFYDGAVFHQVIQGFMIRVAIQPGSRRTRLQVRRQFHPEHLTSPICRLAMASIRSGHQRL